MRNKIFSPLVHTGIGNKVLAAEASSYYGYRPAIKSWRQKLQVTMVIDLQPDGLTAEIAGHCQLDKKISIDSDRKRNNLCVCFKLTS